MSAIEKRDGFTTKWGFILACIGSAVGMGNIWRFPVLVSEMGGMTFLIPYFIFVIFIGSTGVIEEFALENNIENSLEQGILETNIEVKIATGGTLARKYVKEIRPSLIIAVACKRDLISGIRDAEPFLVYGVFNKIKNESCINTTVAIEDIYAILEEIS